MKIVLDTNILWVSISRRSETHWIFRAILDDTITLCVTTDILDEYAEIMTQKLGFEVSETVLSTKVLKKLPFPKVNWLRVGEFTIAFKSKLTNLR